MSNKLPGYKTPVVADGPRQKALSDSKVSTGFDQRVRIPSYAQLGKQPRGPVGPPTTGSKAVPGRKGDK